MEAELMTAEKRCEAATKGPWLSSNEFAVHARADLPAALRTIRALVEAVKPLICCNDEDCPLCERAAALLRQIEGKK